LADALAERLSDGFEFLMPAPGHDLSSLEAGHGLTKRK